MADNQKRNDDEMRQDARLISSTSSHATEAEAGLPLEAQGLIGHQLRQEYRRVLSEPLPDKFTKLLDELAKSEVRSDSKSESTE